MQQEAIKLAVDNNCTLVRSMPVEQEPSTSSAKRRALALYRALHRGGSARSPKIGVLRSAPKSGNFWKAVCEGPDLPPVMDGGDWVNISTSCRASCAARELHFPSAGSLSKWAQVRSASRDFPGSSATMRVSGAAFHRVPRGLTVWVAMGDNNSDAFKNGVQSMRCVPCARSRKPRFLANAEPNVSVEVTTTGFFHQARAVWSSSSIKVGRSEQKAVSTADTSSSRERASPAWAPKPRAMD